MQAVVRPEVGKGGGGASPSFCDFEHFFFWPPAKRKSQKNEKEKEHTHI